MDINERTKKAVDAIIEKIDLPSSAYDKANKRYSDIGNWFDRIGSLIGHCDVHVYPQGSFRLGTAIRPLERDEYDLDIACQLDGCVSKSYHTQGVLKNLVHDELQEYRNARNIEKKVENKHRCCRLIYRDEMSFHIDVVPCIPEAASRVAIVESDLREAKLDEGLVKEISQLTVNITDDRHPDFKSISDDWLVSNPEGYARWFSHQCRLDEGRFLAENVELERLPLYRRKLPLQKIVQIMKRHRDQMFRKNPDSKPISIIISTLAARAYNGERDLVLALKTVLERMGKYVSAVEPRIPNPTNPKEDFADRWGMKPYRHLKLEDNFWGWLAQIQQDFDVISRLEEDDVVSRLKSAWAVTGDIGPDFS